MIQSRSPLRAVTSQSPCNVCGKPDWCTRSEDGEVSICMRTSNGGKQTRNGGYFYLNVDPAERTAYVRPDNPKTTVAQRDKAYSAFLDRCPLEPDHAEHLRSVRRLSEDTITRCQFASIPALAVAMEICDELEREGIDLDYIPGFYLESHRRRIKFGGMKGIFIPIRNAQGQITAMQVRRDVAKERRYMLFSSATGRDKEGKSFDLLRGASSGVPPHYARPWRVADRVCITEGPLKAEIAAEIIDAPFVGLVGVGTFDQNFGWRLRTDFPNLKSAAIAYDADAATNDAVALQRDPKPQSVS